MQSYLVAAQPDDQRLFHHHVVPQAAEHDGDEHEPRVVENVEEHDNEAEQQVVAEKVVHIQLEARRHFGHGARAAEMLGASELGDGAQRFAQLVLYIKKNKGMHKE
jgi:hypothetical protein